MTDQPRNPALGLPLHEFPYPWASEWGEDEYGIWIAFTYKGIRHAFRWITPGTFLMGSPENEPERDEDELQHQVTLTQGFWLGETTVTQALWQAIMSDNPSRFEGDQRPVEQINWEDAQKFIEAFQAINPELSLRLPTEAEWEYACRAGTITPYYIGDQIGLETVWYGGVERVLEETSTALLNQTREVKNGSQNSWGLYQMHGNVREWCQDWFGDYTMELAVDPQGPGTGESRVVRGGSWFSLAGSCRSACRSGWPPSNRYDYTGFRLAADHSGFNE